jgi:hypothetical protein
MLDTTFDFSLLSYDGTNNLGDEIQSLAALQFIPKVSRFVDRERLDEYAGPATDLILNGWYMHPPGAWPPSPRLRPPLTSFHISREISILNQTEKTASVSLIEGQGLEYLRANGPVGAGDLSTKSLLE